MTVSIFALLFACNAYTQGGWLMRYACPMAAYPLLLCWLAILMILWKRPGINLKTAAILLIAGWSLLSINSWVDIILAEKSSHYAVNSILGAALILAAAVTAILGVLRALKSRA